MTEPIAAITHYLKLSDRLATAGQPTGIPIFASPEYRSGYGHKSSLN